MKDKLDGSAIRSRLKSKVIGSKIITLGEIESTNDLAWKEAFEGAPDGMVIFAEEQTRGRGRFGRTWFSPRGTTLLFSVVLRPEITISEIGYVTAIGALAVTDAAEDVGVKCQIRFPNDVVVENRKLCGILTESRSISGRPDLFILGIGVNVNVPEFPADLRKIATSLMLEKGSPVNRVLFASSVLQALDDWYRRMHDAPKTIQRAWKERSYIIGRHVEVKEGSKTLRGRCTDVEVLEGLTLRLDTGHMRQIRGEHVELLKVLES